MGNNKQLNTIFDECLEKLLNGNETIEQCLQHYPEYASELEPLLRTALLMNKAVDVKPSPDFRARARARLQSTMAESKIQKRTPVFATRWAVAVCAVLLVFVLSGSMVLAADGSMPGNPLYTVKLWTEDLAVKLAGSEEKKTELFITFADRRISELDYLLVNNNSKYMEDVAQNLYENYTTMNQLPMMNAADSGGFSLSSTRYSGASESTDNIVGEQLPGSLPTVTTSSAVPPSIVISAPPDPEANDAGLKGQITYYATTQPEKIQELLASDKIPEYVKIILRRALWEAENGFQNSLNNLK